MKFKRITREMP